MGDPVGSVLDAIRFHSLGAILDWLAGWLILPRSHVMGSCMCLVFLAQELTEQVSILWHSFTDETLTSLCFLQVFFLSFSRGGYSHASSHRVGFLRRFGLKTSIHFAHFGLESGMVFEGTTGVYERIYRFNSKWVRKKEKYANWNRIWRIFCLRSNLSNDNIISVQRPGLKTGVENYMVWNS